MKTAEKKKYVKVGSVGSYVSKRRASIEKDRIWLENRRKSRSVVSSDIAIAVGEDKSN